MSKRLKRRVRALEADVNALYRLISGAFKATKARLDRLENAPVCQLCGHSSTPGMAHPLCVDLEAARADLQP